MTDNLDDRFLLITIFNQLYALEIFMPHLLLNCLYSWSWLDIMWKVWRWTCSRAWISPSGPFLKTALKQQRSDFKAGLHWESFGVASWAPAWDCVFLVFFLWLDKSVCWFSGSGWRGRRKPEAAVCPDRDARQRGRWWRRSVALWLPAGHQAPHLWEPQRCLRGGCMRMTEKYKPEAAYFEKQKRIEKCHWKLHFLLMVLEF